MKSDQLSQFELPCGWRGRLAGGIMAWWNAGLNRLALEMLDLRARDHVLEILGFTTQVRDPER
jgi:hypothetical protein